MKRQREYEVVVRMGCALAVLTLGLAMAGNAKKQESDVVAHEWGTFTSIAGNAGTAVQWYPWSVPSDLPQFIEEFQARNFKLNLYGTIRMETPVLYFYSPRETKVSVHVRFSKGLITEWYPHVQRYTPSSTLKNAALLSGDLEVGSLTWDGVAIRPGDESPLPRETNESRYYAARATASAPLQVASPKGAQNEKFLFYRGVSREESPIAARALGNGDVQAENQSGLPLAMLMMFDRRGAQCGFRSVKNVEATTLHAPALSGTVEAASEEMLATLMNEGLYPDEARAMVETWKDAWFEEGTRLLYIVPRPFVDRVLPLTITPTPANVTRVFVGRLELVSPRTQTAIETALATGDEPTLAKYNRFLRPMLEILAQREVDPVKAKLIHRRMQRPYAPLVAQELPN
jgi:hypothetical protein